MQVESKLRFSISASADNAWNMASSVPSSRHLANRAYTDCQGPYASGNSRHCAPLRAIQSIPLSIFRSSFRGCPRSPFYPEAAPLLRVSIVVLSIYIVSYPYFTLVFHLCNIYFSNKANRNGCPPEWSKKFFLTWPQICGKVSLVQTGGHPCRSGGIGRRPGLKIPWE